ncbi:hypothetical protein K7432_006947 [Basidiobolus ranarum]|uniref:TPX2 C-terminal domain-containing protein n=1 Tax=Basidiobolus ranarum TaxID=34480 RepID=A0ABR2W1A4_9FUNG
MIGESDRIFNDIPNELDNPTLQDDSDLVSDDGQDNPFIGTSPEELPSRNTIFQTANLRTSWEEESAYDHPEDTYASEAIPVRSTKKLTVPRSPNFSKRSRQQTTKSQELIDNSDELLTKKRNRTNPFDLTVPKPFRLLTSVRGRQIGTTIPSTMPKSPFVSMASRVDNFFKKTPERFKIKPTKKPSASIIQSKLTVPRSPKLMTKVRAKYDPSQESVEDAEEESRPRKIRTHLRVNGLTIPRSPNITKVIKQKVNKDETVEKKASQKLPGKSSGITIPRSPNITKPNKKRRIDFDVADHCDTKVARKAKPNGITIPRSPNITKPKPKSTSTEEITRAKPQKKKNVNVHMPGITVPEPFHFVGDSIRERKLQKFREKLQREQEEADRLHHIQARPMLDLDCPDPLPLVEPRPLTKPVPFRLETDLRGESYQKFLQSKLKQEEEVAKQMTIPRANPMPDFSNVWYPKHSERTFTIPEPIHLSTEERIHERHDWEALVQQEKEQTAAVWEVKRQEMAKEEEKRLREYRQTLVHKPVPIPETLYRPDSLPRPSQKNLTIPESPAIHKKSSKSRTQVDNSKSKRNMSFMA